jgi:hypothetical protein
MLKFANQKIIKVVGNISGLWWMSHQSNNGASPGDTIYTSHSNSCNFFVICCTYPKLPWILCYWMYQVFSDFVIKCSEKSTVNVKFTKSSVMLGFSPQLYSYFPITSKLFPFNCYHRYPYAHVYSVALCI